MPPHGTNGIKPIFHKWLLLPQFLMRALLLVGLFCQPFRERFRSKMTGVSFMSSTTSLAFGSMPCPPVAPPRPSSSARPEAGRAAPHPGEAKGPRRRGNRVEEPSRAIRIRGSFASCFHGPAKCAYWTPLCCLEVSFMSCGSSPV